MALPPGSAKTNRQIFSTEIKILKSYKKMLKDWKKCHTRITVWTIFKMLSVYRISNAILFKVCKQRFYLPCFKEYK